MRRKRIDKRLYVATDTYQLIPIQELNHPSEKSDRKKIISQLSQMNASFLAKGAGQIRWNDAAQENQYFDLPHFSYKLYKQNGQIYQYVTIPQDKALKQTIQQALSIDVQGCKFIPGKLTLDEQNLYSFAVKGAHHLAIDLSAQNTGFIKGLFDMVSKDEQLIYSLTIKECEDHETKRNDFLKRLAGVDPDNLKSVLWYHTKAGIIRLGDFLLEEETKQKYKPWLHKLRKKQNECFPCSRRKSQSEANRYLETEVLWLLWTGKKESAEQFQSWLQDALTRIQGENRLELVEVFPDLRKVEKGYLQYDLPHLCLYQKELNQLFICLQPKNWKNLFTLNENKKQTFRKKCFLSNRGRFRLPAV